MSLIFRVLFSFSLLLILPTFAKAQPTESLLTKYALNENAAKPDAREYRSGDPFFLSSSDPSGKFFHFALPGHHYTSDPGKPQMPVMVHIVEVPVDMTVSVSFSDVHFSSIKFNSHGLKGKMLYPSQIESTKNELPDDKVKLIDNKLYARKSFISHDTVTVTLIGRHRDKDIYEVAIYPLFYNPAGETVNLITSMNLDVTWSEVKGTAGVSVFEEQYENPLKSYITGYAEDPVGMIILTDTTFKNVLKPFLQWKTISGYDITTIYRGAGLGGITYDEIKATLSGVYSTLQSQNKAPQYLLIAGDLSIIPSSGNTTNVSDLYYAEFDGNNDYIPELFTGRLPVADSNQLKVVVKKIIDYEKYSYDQANRFWERAVITAGNDAGYSSYMNGQVNYVKDNYLNSSDNFQTVSWRDPTSSTKDDSLRLMVNKGLGILNYTGHGNAEGLADPTLKTENVSALSNSDMYPLIIANACRTAQISNANCFGSMMVISEAKGAIGYIGCTNDSYWSEDFYWAVGTGTPDLTATYSNTGLGAFDRLFHSHNEDPSEWYYTLGQILYAGNMSVSASSSSKKKYYWETYMLLGDPTMIPIIGKPDTLSLSISDTIPYSISSLTFLTSPFAYAAISDFDTLWDASFAGPSGNVSLSIPDGARDSCLIVVTGQGIVPLFKTLHFGDNSDEMLTYSDLIIDDSSGNNNGKCDYGEKVNLSLRLSNLGSKPAKNISTSLSVAGGPVSIERGLIRIPELAGGSSVSISDSLVVNVSGSCNDQDIASLFLSITDDKREYLLGIDFTLNAPVPKLLSCIANDSVSGNFNGVPDVGEVVALTIKILNDGSSVTSGTVRITDHLSLLSLSNNIFDTGVLNPGDEKYVSFPVTISPSVSDGTIIPFTIDLDLGGYTSAALYSLRIGKTRETWEPNSFTVFPWITSEHYQWTITSTSSFENNLSAMSGITDDDNESILAINLNNSETDTLSFYARVSSEETFDLLIFRCDSIERMSVSGESGWFKKSFIMEPGIHYLEWVYKKDKSLSAGLDAAWVDLIDFPDHSFHDIDIKADKVFTPVQSVDHSNDIITGRIINLGRATLTTAPLSYRVNDGEAVNENFDLNLKSGDTTVVVFTARYNLSVPGSYDILLYGSLPEDGYVFNDTTRLIFDKKNFDYPEKYSTTVKVLPNPFKESTKFDYFTPESGTVLIEVSDISGTMVHREMQEMNVGLNEGMDLDLTGLAAGVYFLQLRQANHIASIKIIKTGY